jgi:SipA vinculin binding site
MFRCAKNVSNCLGNSLSSSSNVQMRQECQQLPWQFIVILKCSNVPRMSATALAIHCRHPQMFRCAKNVSNCLGSLLSSSNMPRMSATALAIHCRHPQMFRCAKNVSNCLGSLLSSSNMPRMSATALAIHCRHPLMFRCAKNVSSHPLICQECQQLPWQFIVIL